MKGSSHQKIRYPGGKESERERRPHPVGNVKDEENQEKEKKVKK